jgi:serine/threonine-protein kinase
MKEEKNATPWYLHGPAVWMAIAFAFAFAVPFLARSGDLIPIMGMVAVTAWITIPLYYYHKRQQAKEAAKKKTQDPESMEFAKKLQERLENLETLICRLDSEMNYRLERSLSAGNIVTSNDPLGSSQMPTTFMNVTSALESRYQILKELGRGGMGIVYQAYDKQLKEQVAIKILSPLLSHDSDALERMKREVSAARRVTHPNVIRIHDISELNGLHFVSMEYFEGTNLKDYIRKNGALSLMEAYNIAAQICEALETAHRQGVVHRDLKSQNVIVNPLKQVKIIDFGLARSLHLEGMTASGLIMGTPEYMAPEQVSGKKVDERADIYSLGVILYELMTGRVPFTGDSAIAVGFKQLKEDPPMPREVNPAILPEMEAVILKALAKDPLSRYQSVSEFRLGLEETVAAPVSEGTRKKRSQEQSDQVKVSATD